MKKLLYLIPAVGMLMASCSSEEPLGDQQNPSMGYEATSYLSLKLSTGPSGSISGSRADDPVPGNNYQDGDADENNIKSVRFFFFAEGGAATPVWVNNGTQTTQSYLDWYPSLGDFGTGDPSITVEKTLSTTLGLNVPDGSNNPTMVVAILNPTEDLLSKTNQTEGKIGPSLQDLQSYTADYYTDLHSDNFVMSNSIYVDEGGDVVEATEIPSTSFKQTIEEAMENKITIYVERVLARLDFSLGMTKVTGKDYYSIDKVDQDGAPANGNKYNVDDQDTEIYVQFLGWNITNTTDASRLLKSIDSDWSNNLFGNDEPWNIWQFHRSFWAMNPTTVGYWNGNFGQVQDMPAVSGTKYPANGQDMPASTTDAVTVYLQENASPFETTATALEPTASPTQVIIAAQLVGADGKPLTLAEYNYKKYTLNNLKTQLANNELSRLYKKVKTGDLTEITKIEPSDINFVTAQQLKADPSYGVTAPKEADYYVYAVINTTAPEGSTMTWQIGNSTDAATMTTQAVNQYIMDIVNHVMIWNNGLTYYYFDIRHLGSGSSVGALGVVRNHIYKTNVKSITGLGTPVYDPDQVIIPEKPKYDESLIQADIDILQWRIVSQDYDLEW